MSEAAAVQAPVESALTPTVEPSVTPTVALPQGIYDLVSRHPAEVGSVLTALREGQMPDPATLTTLGAALGIDASGVGMDPNMLMGLAQMMGAGGASLPLNGGGAPAAAPAPTPAARPAAPAAFPGGMAAGHPLGIGPRIDAQGNNMGEAQRAPAPAARPAPAAAAAAPAATAPGVRPTGRGRAQRAQPDEAGMKLDEAFNLYGQHLVQAIQQYVPGVEFGFTVTANGTYRVGCWLPGDDEDPQEDVISEVEANPESLGDAISHVFQEAQGLLMQGPEGYYDEGQEG